jgi:hypothetical protein
MIDFSALPSKLETKAKKSIKKGLTATNLLEDILKAENLVKDATEEYRPQLIKVRRIEKLNRDIQFQLKILKNEIEITDNNKKKIKEQLVLNFEKLTLKSQKLISSIPSSWENQYNDFNLLVKNEKKLRKKYRRSSDQFYSEMSNLVFILKWNKQFYNL